MEGVPIVGSNVAADLLKKVVSVHIRLSHANWTDEKKTACQLVGTSA